MARRASRSLNPIWVGIAIIVVAAAIGVSFFFIGKKTNSFSAIPSLNSADYLENANGLQGNSYKIEGTIQNSLYSSREKGRLITINVDGPSGSSSSSSGEVIPVLIPSSMNQFEIQRGNRIVVKVLVEKNGLLTVQAIDKP